MHVCWTKEFCFYSVCNDEHQYSIMTKCKYLDLRGGGGHASVLSIFGMSGQI